MEKSFVNTKQIKVEGAPLQMFFEDKKKEIEKKYAGKPLEIADVLSKEKHLLSDKAGGILLGVVADPKLAKDVKTKKIIIFDDGVEIIEIDKNVLIDACAVRRDNDRVAGISYLIPLSEHGIMVDYKFQNRIEAVGDINGLIFFFRA